MVKNATVYRFFSGVVMSVFAATTFAMSGEQSSACQSCWTIAEAATAITNGHFGKDERSALLQIQLEMAQKLQCHCALKTVLVARLQVALEKDQIVLENNQKVLPHKEKELMEKMDQFFCTYGPF